MKKKVLVTCLILTPALSIAGIHKCNVEGKIVYQQNTCSDKQQSIAIQNIKPPNAINRGAITSDEYKKVMQRYAGTYIASPDPYIELNRMQTVSLKAFNKANACKKELTDIGTYGNTCLDFFAYSNGMPENTPANAMVLFLRMTQQNTEFTQKNKAKVDEILKRFDTVVDLKKSAWNDAKLGKVLKGQQKK